MMTPIDTTTHDQQRRKERMMSDTLTSQAAKATHVYVGRQRCGCAVAVCIEDHHAAEDLAEMLGRGYAVTRLSYEEYQATVKLGHTCSPIPASVSAHHASPS